MTNTEWPQTVWSEARQVNSLNGWQEMKDDDRPPSAFFRALREAGRDHEAALFLAQALPRYEAVAWAARVIARLPEAQSPKLRAAHAAVQTWLAEPSEANRRAAGDHAGPTDPPAPATLCALAAFHAGGSVAPKELPAAPSPRGSTGRFAGAAVIAATALAPDASQQLKRALDDGEQLARSPMENGQ